MLELDAYTARADQAEKQIEILIKVRLRIKDTKTFCLVFRNTALFKVHRIFEPWKLLHNYF